jgi:molecular chaperone GrpE (heat shock protein)
MEKMSFLKRLSGAWSVLRGKSPEREAEKTQPVEENGSALQAESEAAALRLDLNEAKKQIEALARELAVERSARADAVDAAAAARLEPVLADLSTVMAQLAVQSHLIDEGKPVGAKDVMALAQKLVRTLEKLGLVSFGAPGEETTFDPALHQVLGGGSPSIDAIVVIRMPGYRLGKKTLQKAMVEAGK